MASKSFVANASCTRCSQTRPRHRRSEAAGADYPMATARPSRIVARRRRRSVADGKQSPLNARRARRVSVTRLTSCPGHRGYGRIVNRTPHSAAEKGPWFS